MYPILENIDPVLKASHSIEGIANFTKDPRFGVIDYTHIERNITFRDKIGLTPEECLNEDLRRECRGIKYDYQTGKILARPYHKFFNIGEFEETSPSRILWNQRQAVLEKLDGSMIHPVYLKEISPLCTRKGTTEVSALAQDFINDQKNYHNLIQNMREAGYTPIFEWCSPKQKIVLDYKEDNLIITNIRNIKTGQYLPRKEVQAISDAFHVPHVKIYDINSNIEDFQQMTLDLKGMEGFIVVINNEFYKIKSLDYLNMHRSIDNLSRENFIIEAFLDDKIDDILSIADPDIQEKIIRYERHVKENIKNFEQEILSQYKDILTIENPKNFVEHLKDLCDDKKTQSIILAYRKHKHKNLQETLHIFLKDANISTKKRRNLLEFLKITPWKNF